MATCVAKNENLGTAVTVEIDLFGWDCESTFDAVEKVLLGQPAGLRPHPPQRGMRPAVVITLKRENASR